MNYTITRPTRVRAHSAGGSAFTAEFGCFTPEGQSRFNQTWKLLIKSDAGDEQFEFRDEKSLRRYIDRRANGSAKYSPISTLEIEMNDKRCDAEVLSAQFQKHIRPVGRIARQS